MEMELREFITKAKKNTYASGEKATRLKDGFDEFTYKEGNYEYRDRYHAKDPKPFGGEEVVWQNGKVVWMMNYYGYMLSDKIDSKKVYGFLREAMSLVDEQEPFRGPKSFKKGDFEYRNKCSGNLERFTGTEQIFYKGEEIYRLTYHGGML